MGGGAWCISLSLTQCCTCTQLHISTASTSEGAASGISAAWTPDCSGPAYRGSQEAARGEVHDLGRGDGLGNGHSLPWVIGWLTTSSFLLASRWRKHTYQFVI